eukprot:8991434-Lingulodinium_polyedra.AAC.1
MESQLVSVSSQTARHAAAAVDIQCPHGGMEVGFEKESAIPTLRASRFEKVVARLCGCSVQLVQQAHAHSKRNLFVEPK